MTATIADVCRFLQEYAPLDLQESYDNAGLIVGDAHESVKGVLVSLDVTEGVVAEAVACGCNLIVSHHPIVFKGLKRFTGSNYVERTVVAAIKNNVAIYASHTNLDSVVGGVNSVICQKLNLINCSFLSPKADYLSKLIVFVPQNRAADVRDAMFLAGAGSLGNYDSCSFSSSGEGSFEALDGANPYVGEVGKLHLEQEVRLEVMVKRSVLSRVVSAMIEAHPYEEVAYDIVSLNNKCSDVGTGMIGELSAPLLKDDFLVLLKTVFAAGCIRYTEGKSDGKICKVAVCGGSGSFLLKQAIRSGADVFVSADFKYHEFFDAEDQIMIADIGHYESEQFTKNLLCDILTKKFSNFATRLSLINTNPIKYL